MTNYGSLEPAGERWRLRFMRHLAHAPDKVWRAIVESEHRDAWFPQRIEGEFRVGAPLRFVSDKGEFDGEVLAYQPPTLVAFRWGTDTIQIEVAPDGDGSVLTLLDTFDERGKAARDAAGWHVCLDALAQHFDGDPRGSADGWKTVNGVYRERLGPEASTIGPPERL